MSERESSCWYNETETPQKMIEGAEGKLFPKLKDSDHWPVLDHLLKNCTGSKTLLDVGCGAASLSELTELQYTGCDLPHIIDKVGRVHAPDADLVSFDFYKDDLSFIKKYDVIVTNAFIDVLDDPVFALEKLMSVSKQYIIVHRQRLTEDKSGSEKVGSYVGFSYSSLLSIKDLEALCKKHNFSCPIVVPWSGNSYSFLMKKEG